MPRLVDPLLRFVFVLLALMGLIAILRLESPPLASRAVPPKRKPT
jgi:hypothetical protein